MGWVSASLRWQVLQDMDIMGAEVSIVVARDTVQRWPVTCTVAEVTEDLGVFAF